MNNFLELLKKEIKELLTPQMILPFVLMIAVFFIIGQYLEGEREKSEEPTSIAIVDEDQSDTSAAIPLALEEIGYEPVVLDTKEEIDYEESLEEGEYNSIIVIPETFEETLSGGEQAELVTYTEIENFSIASASDSSGAEVAVAAINEIASSIMIAQAAGVDDPTNLKQPVTAIHNVILNGNRAEVNPSTVINFVTSQVAFIPIILFLVITIAAQLVATAMAAEKENKTLETLLASPISRKSIVAAKLLGAGFISLLIAATYMFGMNNLMSSIGGSAQISDLVQSNETAFAQLGLNLTTGDYVMLGLVIFLGILVALSAAFILGSFAQDTRSAQTIIAPVMFMLLIPYLLVMFIDINSASTLVKAILMLIPFTHTFTAATNLMMGNYQLVLFGMIYCVIIIVINIYIASRIFSTEKILTLKVPDKLLGKRL